MTKKKFILKSITLFFIFTSSINVFAQSGAGTSKSSLFTSRPSVVDGVKKPVLSLTGEWNFSVNSTSKEQKINVPGEWEMQGFKVNEGETGVYKRMLNIPQDWSGKRVIIRFDGVSSHAIVKVNEKTVAEHEGSFVPFEADITDALQQNNNVLTVEVQSRTVSDILACTSQYAVHTVGGILRDVILFAVPKTHVNNIVAVTTFDKQYKKATLSLMSNISDNTAPLLQYTLRDKNGKVVFIDKSSNRSFQKANLHVQQWNPEQPYLYELTTALLQNGKPVEIITQKIGFRQVEIKAARVFVNGKPIKLHGVNRHSVHPLTGRSISADLEIKDAVLFREANCNFIRTSHYPPTEAFLNACDSLGLFVEDESSLCWIQHNASPIWKKWNYKDEKFFPLMLQANIEKVIAHRNHPSVILWSLGNESAWSPLWAKVNDAVKQLDPTRPTLFHDQCWGSYNNHGSQADIANFHYPEMNGPATTETMSRPVLFGEFAHLPTYNSRELLTDPGQRAFYGAPLAKMYDSIYYYEKGLGGAIWSGVDDIFHMPDGRLVGYGSWGPIDGWRRKKPEYFGMKKAYAPVKITEIDTANITNGYLTLQVENRYDFTSLKDIKITATFDGNKTEKIASSIPARSSGHIKIPVPGGTREVTLSFFDPRGFVSNKEVYTLGEFNIEPATTSTQSLLLSENDAAISVKKGPFHFLISKRTGIITKISKGEKVLMTQGPVFAVMPRNSDDGGKPHVAGETYQNDIYPLKGYPLYTIFTDNLHAKQAGDSVLITMTSTFKDGSKADLAYTFIGDLLKVNYKIDYKGNDNTPYQYGMLMELPEYMNKLSWHRNAEFTGYPENDIARAKGHAYLNARPGIGGQEWGVAPKGDWKDDATELGSNDFRSTKRNIYTASLEDEERNAIKAWGKGIQSSRSWFQDEHIQWLIADYCNNGSERFYASPFTDGRIQIKEKTLTGGAVLEFK